MFLAAYDTLLARWPATTARTVPTSYGDTHVNICGDGPPLVLLHGGGATSTVWYANVAELGHTIYAVDVIGSAGRSVRNDRPLRKMADLSAWLDDVLDGLGLTGTALAGHSYGGQIALHYALHAPGRVTALALLDPTLCFAGFRAGYLLRALRMLRPTATRIIDFLRWETAGRPLDPDWLRVYALGATEFKSTVVFAGRPKPERIKALRMPVMVLLAERSRAHDVAKVAGAVGRLLPHAVLETVPLASHHSLPADQAPVVNAALRKFLL